MWLSLKMACHFLVNEIIMWPSTQELRSRMFLVELRYLDSSTSDASQPRVHKETLIRPIQGLLHWHTSVCIGGKTKPHNKPKIEGYQKMLGTWSRLQNWNHHSFTSLDLSSSAGNLPHWKCARKSCIVMKIWEKNSFHFCAERPL